MRGLQSNTIANSPQSRDLRVQQHTTERRALHYSQNDIKNITDLFTRVLHSPFGRKKATDSFIAPSNVNPANLMTNSDILKRKFEFKLNQKTTHNFILPNDASNNSLATLEKALSTTSMKKPHLDLPSSLSPEAKTFNEQTTIHHSIGNTASNHKTRGKETQHSTRSERYKKKPEAIKDDVFEESFWLAGYHVGPNTTSHKASRFINPLTQSVESDILPPIRRVETNNSTIQNRSIRLRSSMQSLIKKPSLEAQKLKSERDFAMIIGRITENENKIKPKNSLQISTSRVNKVNKSSSRIESIRPESFMKQLSRSSLQRRQTAASIQKHSSANKLSIDAVKAGDSSKLLQTARKEAEQEHLS